jgi:5-methylcytosine-specific restriction endonuclease McrA
MGNRALVLNATYEPIAVVSLHRAVILVLAEKAAVVAADEHAVLRSVSVSLPQPTVIRLTRYVRVPYRRAVTLSRLAVLRRDQHRCQYCDAKADTVDHVVPRSRGGEQCWGNLASACRACNARKADRTPAEAGMRLRAVPREPVGTSAIVIAFGHVDETWTPFLGDPAGELFRVGAHG